MNKEVIDKTTSCGFDGQFSSPLESKNIDYIKNNFIDPFVDKFIE
jgi:hypothetical protein